MKFRASNADYYREADSIVLSVVAQSDFFLVMAGSYTGDRACTKQKHTAQFSENELILHALSNCLSQSIQCRHHEKKYQNTNNEKCQQLSPVHSHHTISLFCYVEKNLTTTVTINHCINGGGTTDRMLRFFLTKTGSNVIAVAANLMNQISVTAGPEPSAHTGCASSTSGRMLLDTVGCGLLATASQESGFQGKADNGACLSVVRCINVCQDVQSIAIVLRLAQVVITWIRSKKVLSFLCSSRRETVFSEQTDTALSKNKGNKRKRYVDLSDESSPAKTNEPEHLLFHPYSGKSYSREIAPKNHAEHEPALHLQVSRSDHDCPGSFVYDDTEEKNQESSRKDRKISKRRVKRRHSMHHSSDYGSPKWKEKEKKENFMHGSSNGILTSNIKSTEATMKMLKLGDVDNELSSARKSISNKISSNRNAYLTTKRNQGIDPMDIQNSIKMKWQSWNVFRQDHQDPTSSLSTSKQKSHNRISDIRPSLYLKVEECKNLNRTIINTLELRQTELSQEKVICHDCTNQLPSTASDACNTGYISRPSAAKNSVSSYLNVHLQLAEENPFQQHRNQQASEHINENFPTDRKTTVLCSEAFLELWGDVVAAIVAGEWMKSPSCGSPIQQLADKTITVKWRKISVVDSPLLNGSGIDMEASRNSCFLVILASHLQSTAKAKKYILNIAELAALGRYAKCYIFLCLDEELTTTMTKHVVKIQFAATTSSVHIICKTSTISSLATTIAHTILGIPDPFTFEDHLAVLSDRLTLDRTIFLTSLLPVASISGNVRCLALAKGLLPIGSPYFEILLKNQRLRQKILVTILCHETTDTLNPMVLVQLSDALWHGRCI